MLTIDLNADLGEGMPEEEALMPLISSANIACGGHAGDAVQVEKTIQLALTHGVSIGIHPSYDDKKRFGRADLMAEGFSLQQVAEMIRRQIRLFLAVCEPLAVKPAHLKLHGALYNRAAADPALADRVCGIMLEDLPGTALMGLAGSLQEAKAREAGIPFIREAFADRRYLPDGSLCPRSLADALIEEIPEALLQVKDLVQNSRLKARGGSYISIEADSLCIHGDGRRARELALAIRSELESLGFRVAAASIPRNS